jgi:hypothetical protein
MRLLHLFDELILDLFAQVGQYSWTQPSLRSRARSQPSAAHAIAEGAAIVADLRGDTEADATQNRVKSVQLVCIEQPPSVVGIGLASGRAVWAWQGDEGTRTPDRRRQQRFSIDIAAHL